MIATDLSIFACWDESDELQFFSNVELFEGVFKAHRDTCQAAEQLEDWFEPRYQKLVKQPNIVKLNQLLLLYSKQFFQWFNIVNNRHKYHLSPNGHTCIFQVYAEGFQKLLALEARLSPPMLFIPAPPPPPPPPPQIEGIFIGEEEF